MLAISTIHNLKNLKINPKKLANLAMTSEITTVKSFFATIQVHLSPAWLESCINWCKSETLGPNHTPQDLQTKVYEQWLLLDLRDVEVPVLPSNLGSKQNFTLTGNYCLQMMQIVDISKPKLWQLNKIRNVHALTKGTQQDADVVGTGKRMLQVTLTDGVQEVEAMEYKPVACLSLNLAPGTKIRIIGPVVVRRGRLMLEDKNVKVLGGEVEELLVHNAAENVLARALKLPENPNPGIIEEKMFVVEKEEKNEGYTDNLKISKVNKPQNQPILMTTEEEELMNEEFEMLMEAENEIRQQEVRPNVNNQQPKPPNLSLSLDDDDDDYFNDIDIDTHLNQVESKCIPQSNFNQVPPKNTPQSNIITISKLLEKQDNITKGVFKIRVKFKGVEEKLTLGDGEYKLTIKVEDSSGGLVVAVHSDVVSEFAECSPSDIMNLKSNVLGKDEAAVEKMMKTIMKVKERLTALNTVVMVQIERNKRPVIIKVL